MTSILKVDTLQDSGGNTILSSNGTGTFTSSLPNTGITMAQQWRLTADLVGDADPISSNLEIVDTGGYGGIGSSMTESSGIFTFPSTGIYLINFHTIQRCVGTADYVEAYIQTTTDNSTYYNSASTRLHASSTGTAFQGDTVSFMFDVTNISTHKTRFRIRQATTSNLIIGSTSYNWTYMTFVRLGDT